MPAREAMWQELGEPVDLLVIGGGITGAGIARDAARRGLRVALVEMRDLAYGTSSRSSKLVHGGLRYLEQFEFSLVFEAVSERRILLDIAPHLVNPLGFLFPVYKGSSLKLWFVNAGMWLYDGLSLFRSPKRHQSLSPKEVKKVEPALSTERMSGAPLYYDCATDDARLTLENAIDAVGAGATVVTHAAVRSFIKDANGRVTGAMVEDRYTGALKEVSAHVIINATGPWTDRTIAMSKPLASGRLLRPTKGIHVVVEREKLPMSNAVVCLHPVDRRVLFAIPWGDRTYIGTTDTDYEGDPADIAADWDDVDYLVSACATYFPDHPLTHDDVIATWAGLRPLIRPVGEDGEVDESSVSREHQIIIGQDGLITIAGGKLTTYRRMAAEVVDSAVNLLRLSSALPGRLRHPDTDTEPLPGAVGWPEDDDHEAVGRAVTAAAEGLLSPEVGLYLANNYGMKGIDIARLVAADPALATPLIAGRPEILGLVDWGVTQEFAAGVVDILKRRTQIYYRDLNQGLDAVEMVAARMQTLLGWDEQRRQEEMKSYQEEVARSRRWKTDKRPVKEGE
jgi:glycerol-3-phosphate dehydrogenase